MKRDRRATRDLVDKNPPAKFHIFSCAVLIAVAAGVFGVTRLTPPAPIGPDAPAEKFSAVRALDVLHRLLPHERSHPIGSDENADVARRIVNVLSSLGYSVQTQSTFTCGRQGACGPVKNLVAKLPGKQSGKSVALVAHYDSAPVSPGVSDDGSGVAVVLETARLFKYLPAPENSVIFLLTDGEELGALGAEAFVSEHPWARDVATVINLDARGSAGPSLMFETGVPSRWLISEFAASVERPIANSLFFEVYRFLPNDTDFSVFRRHGLFGANFAFIDNASTYHTAHDTFQSLSLASLQHQGDNAASLLRRLANADLQHVDQEDAVYTDLIGFKMMYWPKTWTIPIAIVICLLAFFSVYMQRRSRGLRLSAVGLGVMSWVGQLLAATALASLVTWLLTIFAQADQPWYAHPDATRIAIWCAAVSAMLSIAFWTTKRVSATELIAGSAIGSSLILVALAAALPGAVPIMLIATTMFVSIVTVCAFLDFQPLSIAINVVAVAVCAAFYVPSSLLIETAVGFMPGGLAALPIALCMTVFMPLLLSTVPRGRRYLIGIMVVSSLAAVLYALSLPHYSADHPQPINVVYFQDKDRQVARWVIDDPTGGRLPESMEHLRSFDPPDVVFPWMGKKYRAAKTTMGSMRTISIGKLSVTNNGDFVLAFTVPEPGHKLSFLVPVDARASTVVVNGKSGYFYRDIGRRYDRVSLFGLKPGPNSIRFCLGNSNPTEMLVIDFKPGTSPGGEDLVRVRTAEASPFHNGDGTFVLSRLRLPDRASDQLLVPTQ